MSHTKEHILQTAMLLFLQKSYKDVTMQEIVKATGLSKGAFYHYFASKEDLFKKIAESFFMLGKTDYNMFPKDSLKNFYHTYANILGKSFSEMTSLKGKEQTSGTALNFFFILFEALKRFPEFTKLERELYHRDLKAWSEIIEFAKNKGEITSTSESNEIAELFLSCIDGVFIQLIASNQTDTFNEKITKLFNIIYTGLKS